MCIGSSFETEIDTIVCMPCAKSPCCKASKAEVNALMYHLTIVEHKLNDSFSHCDHCMNLPCDAVPIEITCVLIYLFILDKL